MNKLGPSWNLEVLEINILSLEIPKNENFHIQGEFVQKLKELESANVKFELGIDSLKEEKVIYFIILHTKLFSNGLDYCRILLRLNDNCFSGKERFNLKRKFKRLWAPKLVN